MLGPSSPGARPHPMASRITIIATNLAGKSVIHGKERVEIVRQIECIGRRGLLLWWALLTLLALLTLRLLTLLRLGRVP